jgi:hypothetical protein
MGEDLEKATKEALRGSKSQIATAVTLLSISIDKKMDEVMLSNKHMADDLKKNNEEMLSKLCNYQGETEAKFKKLSVIMFFSENPKLFVLFLMACLVLMGAGADNLIAAILK